MGTGERKAMEAATNAIASPLLEASIKGAHSAIINVTGGNGVTLDETQEAISYITEAAGANVNIIFGVQQNPELNDQMLISVIATEFDEEYVTPEQPQITRVNKPQVEQKAEEVVETPQDTGNILPNFLNSFFKKNEE
jgi:cell division protein FtsZ